MATHTTMHQTLKRKKNKSGVPKTKKSRNEFIVKEILDTKWMRMDRGFTSFTGMGMTTLTIAGNPTATFLQTLLANSLLRNILVEIFLLIL